MLVHHLNNSRSQRVLWMLEELGIDYKIKRYKRGADLLAPPELRRIHPLGKSPVLEDDGHVLVETGAICDYLVAKTGRFGPGDRIEDVLRYRQFLHYAEGSLMPVLFAKLIVSRVPMLGSFAAERLQPLIDVHLNFVEQELCSRPWFAGDEFTASDVMMSFPLETARTRGGLADGSRATIA